MRDKKLYILFLGDVFLSTLAIFIGFFLRFKNLSITDGLSGYDGTRIFLFMIVVIFSSFLFELYSRDRDFGRKEIFARTSIAILLSFVILSVLFYMIPFIMIGRGFLAWSLAIFLFLQYLWHVGYQFCINLPGFAKRVLIIGTGPLAEKIGNIIISTNHNHILSGYLHFAHEPVYVPATSILENTTSLIETVKREKASKIVISLSERRGTLPLKDILSCKLRGIEVLDAPSFYEQLTGKLLIENITPSCFIFSDGFRITPFKNVIKRIFDILFSSIGVIIALPLIPLIALLIKMDSPGPVFFRQVRLGYREKHFVLYKFRTMRQDAEGKTGAVWAEKNDPRITRVGSFLRKTRLDEIPQLYNVLKGDMSFVGPRPERPEFIEKLKDIIPYYSERHYVKPGITGWAQVKYPYGASVEDAIEKLRYDLFYIKHISFFVDLLIVLETIQVVLFGRGGR
ncbi:MAG: TIGR03013 family XrtA/PEP-CTERM system glycosyltransferase [Nitrospirota bacterium]